MAEDYSTFKAQYDESNGTDAEAAANMERLYEEAQTLGQAYYDNSDFVKMLNETEQDEVAAIRDAVAGLDAATHASYKLSQEMSKGIAVTWRFPDGIGGGGKSRSGTESGGGGIADYGDSGVAPYVDAGGVHYHAFGLGRVPRNDYPALLHEGERVLTASEARAQDAGTGSPIALTITGNSFTGTSEEMADQLWEIIMRKLEQAYTAAAPK